MRQTTVKLHAHAEPCACGHVHKEQHNTCEAAPQAATIPVAQNDTNCQCGSEHSDTGDDDAEPSHMHADDCCSVSGQSAKNGCACKHEAPQTDVDGCGCGHDHGETDFGEVKRNGSRLGVSAVLFVAGLLLPISIWNSILFAVAYMIAGYPVIISAVKRLFSKQLFDETLLMTIASIGAAAMGDFAEACAVMLLFGVGELLQTAAVGNSKRSISALLALKPDAAHKLVDGVLQTVDPAAVAVGDVIIVKPFERVPLDGEVIGGDGFVDESALTGESVPVRKHTGQKILAGGINNDVALTIRVTAVYADSAVNKIIKMTEQAAKQRAPREKFITRFARVYTPAVVGLAVLIAVVPPLLLGLGTFRQWAYAALTLLVISCPCALVISVPLAYFAGLGGSSRKGVLAKGAAGLEALAKTKTVAFDKTGTLTKGAFTVTEVVPANGANADHLIALCAHAESLSTHPIGKAIVEFYEKQVDPARIQGITEVRGRGIRAVYNGAGVLIGNRQFLIENGIEIGDEPPDGTVVYAAQNDAYQGYLLLGDTLKDDALKTIKALKTRGIKTIMLTGDNEAAARHMAQLLGVDAYYAGLLPADKVEQIKALQTQTNGCVAFVGDGINDAPVIAAADVGVSMGGLGSDAAIEASDIVLMTDEPSKLLTAIASAQKTLGIVTQNIVLALGIKGVIILLGLFGISSMWLAIVADVGASLLAVANAARALKSAKN